jgi:hypothetical protein
MKTSISDMWIWLSVVVSIGVATVIYFFSVIPQMAAMIVCIGILFSMWIPILINRKHYFGSQSSGPSYVDRDDMNS